MNMCERIQLYPAIDNNDKPELRMQNYSKTTEQSGAMCINDFCRWAGIGRTAAYAEMKAGRIQARKFGRRTFIPRSEAERWLNALPVRRS